MDTEHHPDNEEVLSDFLESLSDQDDDMPTADADGSVDAGASPPGAGAPAPTAPGTASRQEDEMTEDVAPAEPPRPLHSSLVRPSFAQATQASPAQVRPRGYRDVGATKAARRMFNAALRDLGSASIVATAAFEHIQSTASEAVPAVTAAAAAAAATPMASAASPLMAPGDEEDLEQRRLRIQQRVLARQQGITATLDSAVGQPPGPGFSGRAGSMPASDPGLARGAAGRLDTPAESEFRQAIDQSNRSHKHIAPNFLKTTYVPAFLEAGRRPAAPDGAPPARPPTLIQIYYLPAVLKDHQKRRIEEQLRQAADDADSGASMAEPPVPGSPGGPEQQDAGIPPSADAILEGAPAPEPAAPLCGQDTSLQQDANTPAGGDAPAPEQDTPMMPEATTA
ncbi:hypothetical protein H696_03369 [Fonticula alba]|uniref:Uncharacterized protein n=1 Tax=Fonticula alba TaxID=691883 RepID=A0A058Z8P7_FONAL|nr:hypothetical protein H696_03369 [Fonticula alba]KCV69902.1 hypothetical protein H696_03369 [Fonticula alba]|eukprot:XP_009495508.1 hypothetical protein H696_03369 [Fonticula alba]